MLRLFRIAAWLILVAVVVLGAALAWKGEELARLHAVNSLFDADRIVENFTGMDRLFHTLPLDVEARPAAFPVGPALEVPDDWQDWLERRSVLSAIVLKDGELVHESYHNGTGPGDLRISWSMAKSYLSALFGILLDEGVIDSLDTPVTRYAPTLAGSAYDGVRIRDVLAMSTGVAFDEDYLDFWSDINRMGRVLALGFSMDGFAAGLADRDTPPGTAWRYVSIDTHVLGMVLRGASGQDIPTLLADRLLAPMGVLGAPYYLADGHGTAFVLGGLNMTARDYARLGQLYLDDGRLDGRQIVPRNWVRVSTAPQALTAPGALRYGFQWWIPARAPDGVFYAEGIYGQFVYVDRPRGVVVAITSADRDFRDAGARDDALQMFDRLAKLAANGG